MTKDTHTPGPWLVDWENEDDFEGVPIWAKGRVEYVPIANVPVDYSDRTEREANARLFAAAPDLLEAASALIDDVKRRYPNEELRCEFMLALDAAIAKARGQ